MRKREPHNTTRDKFVLDLRERQGLKMREIATLIGVSRPRAHEILERARYARIIARKRVA